MVAGGRSGKDDRKQNTMATETKSQQVPATGDLAGAVRAGILGPVMGRKLIPGTD